MKIANRDRATAIIKKDGKFLLFHRIKLGHDYFVFPGGGVEAGEMVGDALVREVYEELELKVLSFKPLFIIEDLHVPSWATIHVEQLQNHHYFLVEDYVGEPKVSGPEKAEMNDNNQYHIVWLSLEELEKQLNVFPREGVFKLLSLKV